jgi:hypothetical protein
MNVEQSVEREVTGETKYLEKTFLTAPLSTQISHAQIYNRIRAAVVESWQLSHIPRKFVSA